MYNDKQTENDVKVLKEFLSMDLTTADDVFEKFQTIPGAELYQGLDRQDRFIFKQGTRPDRVTLVAHADTVFRGGSVYSYAFDDFGFDEYDDYDDYDNYTFDDKGNYVYDLGQDEKTNDFTKLISPYQIAIPLREIDTNQTIESTIVDGEEIINGTNPDVGIGADDRAGCAIVWLLQNSGHNLLILDGEESGCVGAFHLMTSHPEVLEQINQSRFAIEFDRRGKDDYKCYEIPVQDEFKKYIEEKTGYIDAGMSSITDISVICESICGVNLSVGYYDEHSAKESLVVSEWLNTLNLTRQMLNEPIPQFSLCEEVRQRIEAEKEEQRKKSKQWYKSFTHTYDPEWETILKKYNYGYDDDKETTEDPISSAMKLSKKKPFWTEIIGEQDVDKKQD
ncbi:MAG: M28 family metallopeptidase [Firmicutes bacterium]|nr:M28 family metallopeptidase [Bacillota bacterium]